MSVGSPPPLLPLKREWKALLGGRRRWCKLLTFKTCLLGLVFWSFLSLDRHRDQKNHVPSLGTSLNRIPGTSNRIGQSAASFPTFQDLAKLRRTPSIDELKGNNGHTTKFGVRNISPGLLCTHAIRVISPEAIGKFLSTENSANSRKGEYDASEDLLLRTSQLGDLVNIQISLGQRADASVIHALEERLVLLFEEAEALIGASILKAHNFDGVEEEGIEWWKQWGKVKGSTADISSGVKLLFLRVQQLQRSVRKYRAAEFLQHQSVGADTTDSSSSSSSLSPSLSSSALKLQLAIGAEGVDGRKEGSALYVEGRAEPVLSFNKDVFSNSLYPELEGNYDLVLGGKEIKNSQMSIDLGALNVQRWMALSRQKLWWMVPKEMCFHILSKGKSSEDVEDLIPEETQFLLGKIDDDCYILLLPLVDQLFRTALYPSSSSSSSLQLSLESGDPSLPGNLGEAVRVPSSLYIGAGRDPFALTQRAVAFLSKFHATFRLREEKSAPGSAEVFGWCTWDAFYSRVSPEGVKRGLDEFANAGIPVKMIILDDGWQSTKNDGEKESEGGGNDQGFYSNEGDGNGRANEGEQIVDLRSDVKIEDLEGGGVIAADDYAEKDANIAVQALSWYYADATDWSKRLSRVEANRKFERLGELIDHVKDSQNVTYWLGVDPKSPDMQAFEPQIRYPCIQPVAESQSYDARILCVEPALAWTPSTFSGIGLVNREKAGLFYDNLHGYLGNMRADGVKVDAQSVLSVLGTGLGGGAALTRHFVHNMEASAKKNLSSNVIGCMAHASENLFSFRDTPIARASDDFYPKDDRSHLQHVASCAYNSLFLGEIVIPDWDCFQSLHPAAMLHAVARGVGGCPIYVSDRVANSDSEILQKLVLPDGTTYRGMLPGRPTRDSLFASVQTDKRTALKVWNRNAVNGVVAAFNVQGWGWNQQKHDYANLLHMDSNLGAEKGVAVKAVIKPSDVDGFSASNIGTYAMFSHISQELSIVSTESDGAVTRILRENETDIYIVAPFTSLTAADDNGDSKGLKETAIHLAALGCVDMINGGGAVTSLEQHKYIEKGGGGEETVAAAAAGGVVGTAVKIGVRGVGRFACVVSRAPSSVWLIEDGQQQQQQQPDIQHGNRQKLSFTQMEHTAGSVPSSSTENMYYFVEMNLPDPAHSPSSHSTTDGCGNKQSPSSSIPVRTLLLRWD